VLVRPEPEGQFTASVVGLPELQATAPTRTDAVQQVVTLLGQWLSAGKLEHVALAALSPQPWFGHTKPDNADQQAYLEELARLRREDLERTLREYDQE
jgi:hypothetical protein